MARRIPIVALAIGLFVTSAFAATTPTAPISLDAIVYHAAAASLLENPRLVERYADALTSGDRVAQARGAMPSGCADNLRWLWAESLATPQARAAGYRRVLQTPTDETVEKSLRAALAGEPLEQIRATRRQDRWDRWADLFNSAGYNLGRLANGQIAGGVKFVVGLVFSHRHFTKVTERERKEWWLIDAYLRGNKGGPHAGRLEHRLADLEARLRKDALRRCMNAAHYYAEREWWHEAYFYVRAAEEAGFRGEKKFRRQVRQAVSNDKTWTERSLAVADTERYLATGPQRDTYRALLEALALGDWRNLKHAGAVAGPALDGTPMADEAQDAMSVLLEWTGDRRGALAIQRDLALRRPETQTGRAASARLDDPTYSPRARYDAERAEFRNHQLRYILYGERTVQKQMDILAEMVTPSPTLLGVAGAFFVTDVLLRSIFVSVSNPVAPDDVLAAGEQLLANPNRCLTPEEEKAIRIEIGTLYNRLRRFEDAATAYRDARILSPEMKNQLAERAADEHLRRILPLEDPNQQILLFERLAAKYPKTEAARQANEHLERLRQESKVDFAIPRKWLAEDPTHWMRRGVRLPRELFDGVGGNGEINERGLVFWRDFPSSATYVFVGGEKKGYLNLTARSREVLRAAAEQWVDEKIMLEEAELALASGRLPFEIRGSAGAAGLIVFPTMKRVPVAEEDKPRFR